MRIAHITDIHVMETPRFSQLWGKRAMGSVNLFILGRHAKFSREVQEALARSVRAAKPDAIVFTGDATAQATDEEFKSFQALYGPLFSQQPTAAIPGNHDTYTQRSCRERAIEQYLGDWTGRGNWPRLHLMGEKLACVAVDSCRAHILSSGKVDRDQLGRLDQMLGCSALTGRDVFVLIHYPLRGRNGEPYGPAGRALSNARDVESILMGHADRITAILHGHEHHGFKTELTDGHRRIQILNPGSSGYAWTPEKNRTAHFNIYALDEGKLAIERFRFDGEKGEFLPEPGGAYATGR
jgi:3',5'-cyclic AMP phosphodiesterase CpdA